MEGVDNMVRYANLRMGNARSANNYHMNQVKSLSLTQNTQLIDYIWDVEEAMTCELRAMTNMSCTAISL